MLETCARVKVYFRAMASRVTARMLLAAAVAALSPAAGQMCLGQQAAQAESGVKRLDFRQPGAQVVSLGRIAYDSQKAGRLRGIITLNQGEMAGTLVLRMLSREGEDLAPQAIRMGFTDPTRKFEIKGLKAGTPVQIDENFVSGSGAAWVEVELQADVKSAPCALSVASIAIKERGGATAEQGQAGGALVASPEKSFAYGQNLLPAIDLAEGGATWKSTGPAATLGKGMAGQRTLVVTEGAPGKWESPVVPISGDVKRLWLQTFVKFDALATPHEHPFEVVFRDAEGKTLPSGQSRTWWWATWGHMYGKWIPMSISLSVPAKAASVQMLVGMRELVTPPWMTGQAKLRNNFGAFEVAGLKLWSSPDAGKPSGEKSAWAGGAPSAAPFTTCAAAQQNSVVLSTHVKSTGNLAFGQPAQWPAPTVWVENYLPIRRTITLKGDVFDWTGAKVGSISCPVQLEPYQNKDVELPIARPEKAGVFSANLDAVQDGAVVGQDVIRWGYFLRASDRADRHDDQYPFFFHPGFTADDDSPKDMDRFVREADTLRALGVRGVRLQCRLWSFDASTPDLGIPRLERMAADYHDKIEPLIQKSDIEAYISFFPKPSAPVPASEEDLAKWRKYMAAVVRAYPRINTFVFGNEEIGGSHVNLDVKPLVWGYRGSLREYIVQFLNARKAAMEARPEITFLIGEATDPQAHVARLFFEGGGGSVQDLQGWAANSYNTPGPIWAKLSQTLQQHGVDVSKMTGILPEIGYDYKSRGPNRLVGEKAHALLVLRTHLDVLTAAPWVKYITFFAITHAGVENHGVFDADRSPKPAAGAYLCMTQTLGAGRPTRVTDLPGTTAYIWQRPDGSKVGILWGTGKKQARVRVGETGGAVIVRDLMGNDTSVNPRSGVIDVEISESPVYLLNVKTLEDGSDVAVNWTLERSADGGRQASVAIRNRTQKALDVDGVFESPAEVIWSDPALKTIHLAPGESQTISRKFTLSDQAYADWVTLTLKLKADGNANSSSFASSMLSARRVGSSPLSAQGQSLWMNTDFGAMNQLRQVTNLRGPIRWTGPEDLSGRGGVLWDAKNFYFRAEVQDDINVQTAGADSMWSNDSIQLGIRPDTSASPLELTLGVAKGQPTIIRLGGKGNGVLSPEKAQLKVTRDESSRKTIYEAAIAWSELDIPEPQVGTHLRFSMLINDSDHSDAEDRQGIQWFGGIYSKDATKWGDLTLCE